MSIRRIYQNRYPYLVTANVHGKRWLFRNIQFAEIVTILLFEAEKRYFFDLYAFVIMPDHLHVLLKINNGINVSQVMKRYKSFVYHKLREKFGYKDKFWQKTFYSGILNNRKWYENSINYIRKNPGKAGLPEQYCQKPYMYFNKEKIEKTRELY